ncbi:MAG: UDP-N-acetylmuramate--L-alanine ligase [Clostridia bacterium]|nr:UDP-N-acetylmuramate--L-alanine ligase [Clostridia bacterium]
MSQSSLLESPEIKNVHFVGIGGISMSGLAEILLSLGYRVSGSDLKTSNLTNRLQEMGAVIYQGHREENIQGPDLVVYTAAVKENNPELVRAKSLNIPLIDRAELLGQVMKKYKFNIAVSGTHGKTTTTSMITMIMLEAGLDPTIHIGGELKSIGGNTKIGGNEFFITEACEYVESFLKFHPYLAVVLNIESDHLDYFRDIEHIKESFYKFTSLIPDNGYLVGCLDDENVTWLLDKVSCKKITYGIKSENAMWSASNITFDESGCAAYKLMRDKQEIGEIKLSVPGIHNVNNSLAAIASSQVFGCGIEAIKAGLYKFSGTHRRFELKGVCNNIKVVDDYAHHPSEIKATLKAAKNSTHSKIWCIFQPHTYTRTKMLLNDFAGSFEDAHHVIISDIYAAREVDKGEIHSKTLAEKINLSESKAIYMDRFEAIVDYLKEHASPGDLIITMGAGDIYKVGEMYISKQCN